MAATATMATSGSARKRLLKEEDMTKVEFETSEEVDVTPTFDTMGLREDLLRGIYAYGRWARGVGWGRPRREQGPGRGWGPRLGVLPPGGWRSEVRPSPGALPAFVSAVQVFSRHGAVLGPARAAGSSVHSQVIHSVDDCLVTNRC